MRRSWPRGVLSLWVAVAFLVASVCAAAHAPMMSLEAQVVPSATAKQLAARHSAHRQHSAHLQHLATAAPYSSHSHHPRQPQNPEDCCILVATKGDLMGPFEVSVPALPLALHPSWTHVFYPNTRPVAWPLVADQAPPPSLFHQKTSLLC